MGGSMQLTQGQSFPSLHQIITPMQQFGPLYEFSGPIIAPQHGR